jgi:hypothetical protein
VQLPRAAALLPAPAHPVVPPPPPPPQALGGPGGRCVSSCGRGWSVRWLKQQRGVTRYNCADSLDRTNVGSFFGAVQVGCGPHVTVAAGGGFFKKLWGQLNNVLFRILAAAAAVATATATANSSG